jgi:geranylgeranyl pyrophosphate synthase
VDDVVSLTGRRGGEDKRGDDLRRGKITRPVLLALASLRGNARARLCLDIKRAKGDIGAAVEVAEQICSMDVLSACREVALTTTASAYEQLKPVLADSIAMRLIKEFAVCTLQRHY